MLKNCKTFSSFSVDDLKKAKEFYGTTLGLNLEEMEMGVLALHLNGCEVTIYPKGGDHTPATFTVLNFIVEDLEKEIDGLNQKGIKFEQYDSQYLKTDEKRIADQGEGRKMAWFKDPAGNILGLLQVK